MTDPEVFASFRDELVDEGLEDYTQLDRILGVVRRMVSVDYDDRSTLLRDALADLLVSLLGHSQVAVANGYLDCEYTDPVVLREAVEQGWADHDGNPHAGDIAWIVGRRYASFRPLAPGERPRRRDAPVVAVDGVPTGEQVDE
jgi:hypothetical protein